MITPIYHINWYLHLFLYIIDDNDDDDDNENSDDDDHGIFLRKYNSFLEKKKSSPHE